MMTRAQDTNMRDMLDMVSKPKSWMSLLVTVVPNSVKFLLQVGLELRDYESESGTKQSFSYDVSLAMILEWGVRMDVFTRYKDHM